MTDEAKLEEPFWDPVALRRGILIATGIETAFFFLLIALSAIPTFKPGTSNATVATVIALLVFFPFVLPAMLLAYYNQILILALGLATIAGMLYVTIAFTLAG